MASPLLSHHILPLWLVLLYLFWVMFYIEAARREDLWVWPRAPPHTPSRGAALTAWSSTLTAGPQAGIEGSGFQPELLIRFLTKRDRS